MSGLARAVSAGRERESAGRGKLETAPPPARPLHIPAYAFV